MGGACNISHRRARRLNGCGKSTTYFAGVVRYFWLMDVAKNAAVCRPPLRRRSYVINSNSIEAFRNRFGRPGVYCNVIKSISSANTDLSALLQTGAPPKLSSGSEFSLTVKPQPGEGIMEMFSRLALALKDADTAMTNLLVYGSVSAHPAAVEAMRRVFGRIDWPVTWVEGAACYGHPIAGMQAFAFSAGRVTPVTVNGRVVGNVFDEGAVRHCLLGGLGPDSCSAPRPDQFRQTLGNLETALEQAGFSMADIVRTWFNLDDLLSWYGPFNEARTQAYAPHRGADQPA